MGGGAIYLRGQASAWCIGLDTFGAVSLELPEVIPTCEAVFVVRAGVIHFYPAVLSLVICLLKCTYILNS